MAMKFKGNQLPWEQLSSIGQARERMEGGRRRTRSLGERRVEDKGGSRTKSQGGMLSNTNNAMKEAMAHRHDRSGGGEHVMTAGPGGGGGGGGEEGRRKPHALPPLQQKPKSPVISTSPIESELTSSARFIGSPPPSGLRRDDNGNHTLDGSQLRRESVSGTSESSGEEERTVYLPANPALEMSQPRITLHTAPRNGSPPPPHAIVSAEVGSRVTASSSLSLRSLASAASETISLHQALTPPPKLVSYRAEGGAEAVQEWIPDEEGKGLITSPSRNTSSPSIRDLPSPVLDRQAFTRPPPPTQAARRTRSTLKLTPINKSIND